MSLGSYFRSLTWPDTVKDAVDLVSKTIVAAVVALVGLAYHHYQQEQIDATKRQAQAAEILQRDLAAAREQREDSRATYGFFVTGMPDNFTSAGSVARLKIMIAFCNDPAARSAIVTAACKNLPTEPVELKASGEDLHTSGSALAYVNSSEAQRANLSTAAVEAASAPSAGAQWFAVVGTVPVSNPGAAGALVASLSQPLRAAGVRAPIQLWRTQISRSFALTLGGPQSQADAVALAARVRATGVVDDAFAQPDRNWTRDATPNH